MFVAIGTLYYRCAYWSVPRVADDCLFCVELPYERNRRRFCKTVGRANENFPAQEKRTELQRIGTMLLYFDQQEIGFSMRKYGIHQAL